MLINLKRVLKAGEHVSLTLKFQHAGGPHPVGQGSIRKNGTRSFRKRSRFFTKRAQTLIVPDWPCLPGYMYMLPL